MTTVLLTGFEPFAGDAANPSGDAVRRVSERWSGEERLVTAVLPVTFAGAAARIRELIAAERPDVVVAVGLAGGRRAVGVERIAVNLIDARIPDNDGAQPVDEPSVPGAAPAHFATVPVKQMAAAIAAAGVPAEVSHTAGTFVCNHVFFVALDAAPAGTAVGFVHVPWATGQAPRSAGAGAPFELNEAAIDAAVVASIRAALGEATDAGEILGGALH